MAKRTTAQRDAMERLRGNPEPTTSQASRAMREADEVWRKLQKDIIAALAEFNPLLAMEVVELQAMYERALATGWKPGQNINGWKNPYPIDDPRSMLKQNQFVSFQDLYPNVCDVASRQTGKGFVAGGVTATGAYTGAGDWTIVSPSERQSLMTLAKSVDWVEAYGLVIENEEIQRDGSNPQALVTSKLITLNNRRTIRGCPGLPRTLRGGTGNLYIDEGDHIENAKEFMRAVIGIVANEEAGKKQLRYITTPMGKNAPSYEYVHTPSTEEERAQGMAWSTRVINIWQAVLMGLKQNPARLLKLYGDDIEGWMQEMLCVWLDASSVLLPYELIQSCESIEASESDTPEMLAQSPLRKVGGIDFGRINDPTVMITALNGLGMNIVRNITELHNVSTPVQMEILHPYMEVCSIVEIDYTGPGIGFGDLAVQAFGQYKPEEGKYGKIKLVTTTVPIKRVMYPRLRAAFEKHRILVPISTELREDLHAMNIVITNSQFNYKAPRTDEGHSDRCTALAHMQSASEENVSGPFAFESTPRDEGGGRALEGMSGSERSLIL
jgi:phage FluMu gp28-like protein